MSLEKEIKSISGVSLNPGSVAHDIKKHKARVNIKGLWVNRFTFVIK